jgi:activating signal cointegrator 1
MKALTICQPYAALICLPDDDDRAKRVENRTWATNYRGPLLIHAGKSKQWLDGSDYGLTLEQMPFGVICGVANVVECVAVRDFMGPSESAAERRFPWLREHRHTEGPWCWVLQECRRFETPIPYRGAQGLFDIPIDDALDEQLGRVKSS